MFLQNFQQGWRGKNLAISIILLFEEAVEK